MRQAGDLQSVSWQQAEDEIMEYTNNSRRKVEEQKRLRQKKRKRRVYLYRIGLCVGLLCCIALGAVVLGDLWKRPQVESYEINEACESYRPQVERIAAEYEMSEYVDLIMAVMMQESSGQGPDVMQASECGYNTKYPNKPGGIKDSTYSIRCGIQELKSVLDKAEAAGAEDIKSIRQALQAYNFGLVYLDYSAERGVDTWNEETVSSFAQMASGGETRGEEEAKAMGQWQYGDQMYPLHVLRYYEPYKLGTAEDGVQK